MSSKKKKKTKGTVEEQTEKDFKTSLSSDVEEMIVFYVVHKGKKMLFEFPSLVDRAYMLRVIKTRISLHRDFCLGWSSDVYATGKAGSPPFEVCIHSSNINSETLGEFPGETFYVLPSNSLLGSEASALNAISEYPWKRTRRKLKSQRYMTSDCPP